MWAPLALTALVSIVLGIYPNAGLHFYDLAWAAAVERHGRGWTRVGWGRYAVKRVWAIGVAVVIGASVVLEIVYRHYGHPVFWWQSTPVFDFVYGTAGCLALARRQVAGARLAAARPPVH